MDRISARRRGVVTLSPFALSIWALIALAVIVGACGGDADKPADRTGERREDAQVFTWVSSDGVTIEAELRRGGEDWVLMGHQFTGNRRDWDQMVEGFVQRGYAVLTWDFRCHGESGCNTENNSKREATKDIWREWVAALDYAVENGARTIHAGGASMGGTSLIQVAADRDDVASIFAISSPNRFQGLDALENYDRVTVPKLFIVGAGDMAAPDFSQRYFDMATGPARLDILETDLHGNTLAKNPDWGPIVQPMLYAFVHDPDGYVAAGEVNNLDAAGAVDAEEADAEAESAADQMADDEATEEEQAEEEEPENRGVPGRGDLVPVEPTDSGYVLALLAPGEGGDHVVIVDPLDPGTFQITRQFDGDVQDVVWAEGGPILYVGRANELVILNLTEDPPTEIVIPVDFLPEGIAADFIEMGVSGDGFVVSFAVVPEDIGQAPSTPALINVLGPTLLAPYAGELNGTPDQAGRLSRDDRLLLAREVGGLVILDDGTLEVQDRFASPEIVDADDLCVQDLCVPVEYSTIFPDEYDWLPNAVPGVFWARYTNKLFLRLPDAAELTEWFTLPGLPIDVAIGPGGRQAAWISTGPPRGTNALFLSDLEAARSTLLVQDEDFIFFDLEFSPDGEYLSFSSVSRQDTGLVGVVVIELESGEIFPIGPGCCAEWLPFITPS